MDPELTGLALAVGGLVAAAAACAAPTGAGLLIATVGGGTGMSGVCAPSDFARSAEAWGQAGRELEKHAVGLARTYDGYKDYWVGAAAESFQTYWERVLFPLMGPAVQLTDALESAASQMHYSSKSFLIGFFGATVICLLTELAIAPALASPVSGAAAAAQWAAAGIFAGYVSAMIGTLHSQLGMLSALASDLGGQLDTLSAEFTASQQIGGADIAAPTDVGTAGQSVPVSGWFEDSDGIGRNPEKDAD